MMAESDREKAQTNRASFLLRPLSGLLCTLILLCLPAAECKADRKLLIAMTDEVRKICEQAERLINARKFKEAEQILKRAEQLDPGCAEVHGYLGMNYQNSLNTQKAVEEYRKALQLNPQMTFIKINLGTCYMNMNRLDEALPYFEQYLQENPNAPDAARVRSYIQQAGSRSSKQNLRQLVETGQSFLNQHRYAEACRAFEQAIACQPDFAPAHFFLGYALGQSGQNQRAIAEFQTSLQLDPGLKDAIMNIGSNYQSLGDCANAIAWYERFLHENPGSPRSGEIQQRIRGLKEQMGTQSARSSQPAAGVPSSAPGQSGYTQEDYLANACPGGRCYRWPAMPVRVFIASGAAVPGFRDSYFQMLYDSFSKWAIASENRLAFQLVQDPGQANIYCDWTGDPGAVAEAGKAVEGGLARISAQQQPGGEIFITRAGITILTLKNGQPLSDDDMKKVCLHEIGHALGINGHSSDNRDVMFFTESATVWPALTKRDKATICRLYASYPRQAPPNN